MTDRRCRSQRLPPTTLPKSTLSCLGGSERCGGCFHLFRAGSPTARGLDAGLYCRPPGPRSFSPTAQRLSRPAQASSSLGPAGESSLNCLDQEYYTCDIPKHKLLQLNFRFIVKALYVERDFALRNLIPSLPQMLAGVVLKEEPHLQKMYHEPFILSL